MKRGFTLFEMIVVIGIMAGFLSLFLVNFSKETYRINTKQSNRIKEQVISAAEAYVVVNRDNSDAKYDGLRNVIKGCGCLNISVDSLIEEGFLVENVVPESFKSKYPSVYFGYNTLVQDGNEIGYQYTFDGCHNNLPEGSC